MPDNPNPNGPEGTKPADTDPAEGTEKAPEKGPSADPAKPAEGEDQLGDAGKKALKTERDARKSAEAARDEALAEVKRLQRANAAVKGTDLEAVKAEIRAEFATQIAETAIKAEAKGRLHDPADALLYIKAAETNGEDTIKAAVDQLLKDRPYLASGESGTKPWGDVGGGKTPSTEPEPASPEDRMRRAYGTKPPK
ncbi:hypothetical protein [Streptomyces globisporus]|uniref:hypothetical protein n=1 Tax=Streptomyces globisporus TaxID=1908 RepID=UPI0037F90010